MGEPESIFDDVEQEDKFFESGGEQVPEEKEELTPEPEAKDEPEKEPEKEKEEEKAPEFELLDENRVKVGDKVFITKNALDEARGETKALKGDLDVLKQQLGQFSTLKEELDSYRKERQGQTEEQKQAEEARRFEEDPIGALKHKVEELKEEREASVAEREAEKEQAVQSRQQAEALHQIQSTTASLADRYTQENPDYPDAYNYVLNARRAELEIAGTPPDQVDAVINQEALNLSVSALRQGKNPAQVLHELAKARGFASVEKKPDEAVDLEKKLETIEKGQRASSTLAGGGGEAEETGFLKDVENMSDEEFDKLWADLESKGD